MSQDNVKLNGTKAEHLMAAKIATRAVKIAKAHGRKDIKQLDTTMDILATHLNGCPLDFQKLIDADDFNFIHDVFGIQRHLNRKTGKLKNCFLPRCWDSKARRGTRVEHHTL